MKTFKYFLPILLASNLFADAELSGDARTSCEVILCMSSGSRPHECTSPIKKFFSIKARKPWKTLQLRRDFLNLCPTKDANNISNDAIMADLKDALVNVPHECTAEALNKTFEYQYDEVTYPDQCRRSIKQKLIRITKEIPQTCIRLINNVYTDLKMPINVCDNKFYRISDFNNGYFETFADMEKQGSYNFNTRNKQNLKKYTCEDDNSERHKIYYIYARKHLINKNCWRYK